MAALDEPEILASRHAFPQAQRLLAGVTARALSGRTDVGWHGTSVDPEQGAVAVVRQGAGLDDLIGEVLRLTSRSGSVYVYVLGARPVPHDISLARHAFFPVIGGLAAESVPCVVEVVE